MVLPPSMQSSLPAGWLTFTGRVLNPLDRYKRFQIIHPPFLDFAWRKGGVMSESLGLTSHKSNCNCTGCGLLRAGVCINCAEKTAALILESGLGNLAIEPCSGACREAIELYFSTPPERWRAPLTPRRL